MKPDALQNILANAPTDPGEIATGLIGWNTRDGYCFCSVCVGRALRVHVTREQLGLSIPVWNRAIKCDVCGASYNADGTESQERPAR